MQAVAMNTVCIMIAYIHQDMQMKFENIQIPLQGSVYKSNTLLKTEPLCNYKHKACLAHMHITYCNDNSQYSMYAQSIFSIVCIFNLLSYLFFHLSIALQS